MHDQPQQTSARIPGFPEHVVLELGDAVCNDAAVVGSKAAILSQLCSSMPDLIPPGIVIPAAAAAAAFAGDAPAAPADATRALLSAQVEQRIRPACTSYAVRSSALEEDSIDRSYAGQYTTVLARSTLDAILSAVAECVGSGSSARIRAYRRASRVEADGNVAVLIQEMVAAERSGVAFTANPVSGASEVIINASYGLGDLLVSGEITPDELLFDADERISASTIGSKRFMSIVTPAGVRRLPVPEALQGQPALSDRQAHAVARAARMCEAQLGFPVDMEWAISMGTVFVLQARPITGLAGTTGDRDGSV